MCSHGDFKPESIIWAADVKGATLKKVVEAGVLPEGTLIKLDRYFFEENDKDYIGFCQEHGYPVFVDAKICDNEERALKIAKIYLKHHPYMLGAMGSICSNYAIEPCSFDSRVDTMKNFADLCKDSGVSPVITTMLSGKTEQVCSREFSASIYEQTRIYADAAIRFGISEIVLGAREAKNMAKQPKYRRLTLNVYGIRMESKNYHPSKNQPKVPRKRETMTPVEAFGKDIDRLIIGKALVYGSKKIDIVDRIAINYRRIVENIFGIEDSDESVDDLPDIMVPEFPENVSMNTFLSTEAKAV